MQSSSAIKTKKSALHALSIFPWKEFSSPLKWSLFLFKSIFSKLFTSLEDPYLHKWGFDTTEPQLAHTSTANKLGTSANQIALAVSALHWPKGCWVFIQNCSARLSIWGHLCRMMYLSLLPPLQSIAQANVNLARPCQEMALSMSQRGGFHHSPSPISLS